MHVCAIGIVAYLVLDSTYNYGFYLWQREEQNIPLEPLFENYFYQLYITVNLCLDMVGDAPILYVYRI